MGESSEELEARRIAEDLVDDLMGRVHALSVERTDSGDTWFWEVRLLDQAHRVVGERLTQTAIEAREIGATWAKLAEALFVKNAASPEKRFGKGKARENLRRQRERQADS